MNDKYKQLQRSIQDLVYDVKDAVDDAGDTTMRSLQQELQRLLDDVESNKNPRSIEARVVSAQRLLQQLRNGGDTAMDFNHIDGFYDRLEDARRDLREFDNY